MRHSLKGIRSILATAKTKSTNEEIEKIDQHIGDLQIAVHEQDGLQTSLEDAQSHSKGFLFQNCWSPSGSNFYDLRQYCGGIASVMPGTICLESDFSLINWTKNPNKAIDSLFLRSNSSQQALSEVAEQAI